MTEKMCHSGAQLKMQKMQEVDIVLYYHHSSGWFLLQQTAVSVVQPAEPFGLGSSKMLDVVLVGCVALSQNVSR